MLVDDIDVAIAIPRRPIRNTKLDWIVFLRVREMYAGKVEMKSLMGKVKEIIDAGEARLPLHLRWKELFHTAWNIRDARLAKRKERARERENAEEQE